VPSFVTMFSGIGGAKFPDKVPAERRRRDLRSVTRGVENQSVIAWSTGKLLRTI